MWPVRLLVPLPEGLRAFEDSDVVELRCARCGWTATFSAGGATAEEIQKAAEGHAAGCPAR